MRIAIWHNLPSGGGKRAMYDQIRGLVGRGHHVEVWCPPTANRSFLPLDGLIAEHVVPLESADRERRGPVARRLQPYLDMVDRLEAMDRHCRESAAQINRGGFDLLLAHPCLLYRATPIARYVEIPRVLYLQEPYRALYEASPRLPWAAGPGPVGRPSLGYWKGLLRDLIGVQALRVQVREELASVSGFDLILVNSLFSREGVLRAYGLDSRVCYLGVDTELFRTTDAPKEGYVVGLGNIYDNKGLDVAVAAVGSIESPRRPDLVWIGNFADAGYIERIGRQAQRLGVRFLPKVNIPDAEVVGLLGRASAMIYTSRLEPFGYAPLEANACGTPVVAVAEGGVRETIRDGLNGTLVFDRDPEALGRAILGYCSDPERSRAVGRAARRHVEENWGLEPALDRLVAKLSWLCDEARRGPRRDNTAENSPG